MLQFHEFVTQFGRNYVGEEYHRRAAIFASNIAQIESQNEAFRAGESSWHAAINEFVDLDESEMKARKGYSRRPGSRPEGTRSHTRLRSVELPKHVDWRERKNVVTPVKDQGACGSCWAHAAAETLESHAALQLGISVELSPQQLVDCMANPDQCGGQGGCAGATSELGFNYTYNGLALAKHYHYKAKDGKCRSAKPAVFAGDYVMLPTNDETALLDALANVGPVAIGVAASTWSFYAGGVFDGINGGGCDVVVDHAVQAVGYGTDAATKKDYWLVRNSWGPKWGEEGYIRVERFPGNEPCAVDKSPLDGMCGISGTCVCDKTVQYCGTCAILSDSSYPTKMSKTPFA